MMRSILIGSLLCAFSLLFLGCQNNSAGPDGSKFLLPAEPAGAKGVIEVRKSAKDKDDVVIVGRVGGDQNPWVEGLAAFSITDCALKACNEIPGDTCPKPWDFCCEADLAKKKALVKIVDKNGNDVEHGAKKLLGLKELDTVVVHGTATRDKQGNLTVTAKGLYVKKRFPWMK